MKERTSPRVRRRIKVRLGAVTLFTADISEGGFCAEIMRAPQPGSAIQGTITVGDKELPFTGKVAWAKPGDARMGVRGRFGVRFDVTLPELGGRTVTTPLPPGSRPPG